MALRLLHDGLLPCLRRLRRTLQALSAGVLSVAGDGRLGVWGVQEEKLGALQPLWGLRGLPPKATAAASETGIFVNCTVNLGTPGPVCETVLMCLLIQTLQHPLCYGDGFFSP